MTQASSEKWQRYEQALLVAMGCAEFPTKLSMAIYQLLIIPAFHPPCCLRLLLTNQGGEFRFSLLTKHAADLFDVIWRENARAESDTIHLARHFCIDTLAALNAEQAASFRQQVALLEPMTLGDINLSARDGVSIRCDCSEQNRYHTFAMRSPTAQNAPRHSNLIAVFIGAAQKQFQDQQIQEYLVSIRRYLH
jgi:hypothetical protein